MDFQALNQRYIALQARFRDFSGVVNLFHGMGQVLPHDVKDTVKSVFGRDLNVSDLGEDTLAMDGLFPFSGQASDATISSGEADAINKAYIDSQYALSLERLESSIACFEASLLWELDTRRTNAAGHHGMLDEERGANDPEMLGYNILFAELTDNEAFVTAQLEADIVVLLSILDELGEAPSDVDERLAAIRSRVEAMPLAVSLEVHNAGQYNAYFKDAASQLDLAENDIDMAFLNLAWSYLATHSPTVLAASGYAEDTLWSVILEKGNLVQALHGRAADQLETVETIFETLNYKLANDRAANFGLDGKPIRDA